MNLYTANGTPTNSKLQGVIRIDHDPRTDTHISSYAARNTVGGYDWWPTMKPRSNERKAVEVAVAALAAHARRIIVRPPARREECPGCGDVYCGKSCIDLALV